MSRHRDVRNYAAEDYDDEIDSYGSSYGSSYVDETSLSTSMEKYIYRRGGSTPKMGHFVLGRSDSVPSVPEEDFDELEGAASGIRPRSDSETSSGSNAYVDLNQEDQEKLSKCLEDVLDIVGDTIPEQAVKEAIIRCDFDSEVVVNTLLNNPIEHRGGHSEQKEKESISKKSRIDKKAIATSEHEINDTYEKKPLSSVPIKYTEIPTIQTVQTSVSSKPQENSDSLKTEERSRSSSPVLSSNSTLSSVNALSTLSGSGRIAMRKARVDAVQAYELERRKGKHLVNMVVVGHVDSGKSTLMGHLLFRLGSISSKVMHKYEQDSKKMGKQSFAYAWVLDETSEERERGITMDVGHSKFETNTKIVTILDAPGHKDFIPNMISGAYQADVAILVVNATRGEFEAGFEAGGQTREHALLVRSLGVSQIAVAANKMDTVNWSSERFNDIQRKLSHFLKQVGFKDSDVIYIPCSGFAGDNLVARSEHMSSWYTGPTLLEVIDAFKAPERLVSKPFRLSISDIFKPQSSGFCVSGRIEAGFVQKDDKVLISPLNGIACVKSILSSEDLNLNMAFAGDHVSLVLIGPDMNSVSNGMVACDPAQPISVSKKFRARIVVFNVDLPITKGFPVVFHYGCVQIQAAVNTAVHFLPAVIKKLVAHINKSTGEVLKQHPRCLSKNCNAIVDVVTEIPVCLELYSNVKELGRFMLRSGGKTIAAGLITDILKM